MTSTSKFTANAELVAQLGQRLDRRNERSQDLLGCLAAFCAAGHRFRLQFEQVCNFTIQLRDVSCPIVDLGAIEDDPEQTLEQVLRRGDRCRWIRRETVTDTSQMFFEDGGIGQDCAFAHFSSGVTPWNESRSRQLYTA
jgi:hypothetical protein